MATPIGNLADVSLRALETLAAASVIACEDTRVTRRLLERYAIATPLMAYHDHNAVVARPKILARLGEGASVALVSDAGTPLVSDPGLKLVQAAHEAGHAVTALPGACAVLAALTIAGLPTDRFFFEGFLPSRETARRDRLHELAKIPATLVLFESGQRIAALLGDAAAILGTRAAAVCRELTKLYEETRRGDIAALAAAYVQGAETRGEFVVIIAPPDERQPLDAVEIDAMLRNALKKGSVKTAVEQVVAATGHKRRTVYQRALAMAREPDARD